MAEEEVAAVPFGQSLHYGGAATCKLERCGFDRIAACSDSLSRLKAIYMTFMHHANDSYVYHMRFPDLDANNPMEWQAQIGPTRYPAWGALKELPERYWNLQQTIGTHQSVFHTNAINLEHYVGDSHVVAIGLDKIQSDTGEDNMSSTSTKMGDLLSFRVKNIKTTVTQAWVTLRHSAVLILSEEGAQYLD